MGQSFAPVDQVPNSLIQRFLTASGITVVTGERPSAGSVSAKVRRRIESCELFVGIFTRRQKIARKQEWTTSNWVVDEKAYAFSKEKRLILIKEAGVQSIGGLQGDWEYLEFERDQMAELLIKLVQLFMAQVTSMFGAVSRLFQVLGARRATKVRWPSLC